MAASLTPATPEHLGTIGITMGDAAGIGPEVIAAALASGALDPGFDYRVIGEAPTGTQPGRPTPETARAAWDALESAASMALAGEVAAVVTGPVSKLYLYQIGFRYPGQTEFFAARCRAENSAMLLAGGAITVALVTAHLPLAEAIRALSAPEIVRVGSLLAEFLQTLREHRPVRVAVAGLNPHAGEGGSLGREEIDIIAPAVQTLQAAWENRGANFTGPHPPDTLFHQVVAGRWDGVLCMYHDQGLIPLKLHAFDEGVNVTIGLPIIRTSPDHGTAFEIAGKNLAHPGSMIAALRLAASLARKRLARTVGAAPQASP
jgi:4-hydroxythreonine-4-phosphate dehydrogenase